MSRKTIWNDIFVIKTYELAKAGLTEAQIAKALGISKPTFLNWEKKKKLYLFGKKGYDYQCVQPNFRGTFPKKAFPFDKEYDERKIAALGKMTVSFRDFNTKAIKQRNELIKYLYNNVGLKQLEISEITSRSEETLSQKAISEVINEKS